MSSWTVFVPELEGGALRNGTLELRESAYDHVTGRGESQERFRVYRLCKCEKCSGVGKVRRVETGAGLTLVRVFTAERCDECRGEGRVLDLVATSGNAEGVGTAIIQLAREGEFDECPLGVLDTEGDTHQKWLVSPWLPSPRNVSDAGKVLAQQRWKGERDGT